MNDGGPAFPGKTRLAHWTEITDYKGPHDPAAYAVEESGMSLRDYFAGQALEGGIKEFFAAGEAWTGYDDFAKSCYAMADAMLQAREV